MILWSQERMREGHIQKRERERESLAVNGSTVNCLLVRDGCLKPIMPESFNKIEWVSKDSQWLAIIWWSLCPMGVLHFISNANTLGGLHLHCSSHSGFMVCAGLPANIPPSVAQIWSQSHGTCVVCVYTLQCFQIWCDVWWMWQTRDWIWQTTLYKPRV